MSESTPSSAAAPENPWSSRLWKLALAVLGGVAWAQCFEADSRFLLPWIALAPFILLSGGRRPFLWGWLHGFVTWFAALPWLVQTVHTFGGLPLGLSWVLFVLLALYLGLDHGLFAWLGHRLARRGDTWTWLGLPSLWVVSEMLRGLPFGGFPWNLAAYAWVDQPGALALSSWVGALGVSWWVLFANVGLVMAIRRRMWAMALVALLLPFLALSTASRFAGGGAWSSGHQDTLAERPGEVRVVQPNSPIVAAPDAWQGYQRLIDMSWEQCQDGPWPGMPPRLIVWPESAAFPFRYPDSPRLRLDIERLAEKGCQVVFNSVKEEGTRYYNAALSVDRSGVNGSYAKRRLVPYGEYVPLADTFSFIGTLARHAGSFTPGDGLGLLPWGKERLGMAICYEVIFPAAMAEQARGGATVLMTITNDAWYGDSSAPWQHFRAARFRAAENRRPMLRAALTGVSGIIDSRGKVKTEAGVGEVAVLYSWVEGQTVLTPYTRFPWAVPWLASLMALFAIVLARREPRPVDRRSNTSTDGDNEP